MEWLVQIACFIFHLFLVRERTWNNHLWRSQLFSFQLSFIICFSLDCSLVLISYWVQLFQFTSTLLPLFISQSFNFIGYMRHCPIIQQGSRYFVYLAALLSISNYLMSKNIFKSYMYTGRNVKRGIENRARCSRSWAATGSASFSNTCSSSKCRTTSACSSWGRALTTHWS